MDGCGPADRQHGRRREGHVHEHDRGRGAEDRVDRPRVRSEPPRLLLCARARDPDAALDDDPGEGARHRPARGGRRNHSGARMELADLVHAGRRGAQGDQAGPHRGRAEEEGRGRAHRRPAQDADREAVAVAGEPGHGREVPIQLRDLREDRVGQGGPPRRARLRHGALCRQPGRALAQVCLWPSWPSTSVSRWDSSAPFGS